MAVQPEWLGFKRGMVAPRGCCKEPSVRWNGGLCRDMLAPSKIPKTQSTSRSLRGLYGQTLFNSLAEPTKWAYVLIQQWNRIKQCINVVPDKSSGRKARAEYLYQQRVLAKKKGGFLKGPFTQNNTQFHCRFGVWK